MPVERDGADLIVADGKPGPAAAHQETVERARMDQRNEGGVFDPADAPALKVETGRPSSSVKYRKFPPCRCPTGQVSPLPI